MSNNLRRGFFPNWKLKSSFMVVSIFLASCVSSSATNHSELSNHRQTKSCELSKKFNWNNSHPPKLIFLSIDSLNNQGLVEFVPLLKSPHPFGLQRILNHRNSNKELIIQNPTITASSHSSTITCSSPSVHGIFANSQWDGTKMVSGFAAPTNAETFATALMKAGLKTVSAGYPALDNSEPGRIVNEGFAYGDTIGQSTLAQIKNNEKSFYSWKDKNNSELAKISISRNSNGDLGLACESSNCVISENQDSKLLNIEISLDNKIASGYAFDVGSKDQDVYISPLGLNKAFPKTIAKKLDSCGIVFSPGKDSSLSRFGSKPFIYGLEHRLNFFRSAWTHFLPETSADAIFIYLEDLDSLRHQFSGDQNALSAVLQHVQRVDQLLGDFFQSVPPETNVVIMGDHGMSTIRYELNIRKILPEEVLKDSVVITSGGTLLLYSKKNQPNEKINSNPSSADYEMLAKTRNTLLKFRHPKLPTDVFQKVYIKNTADMKIAGLDHPSAPYLIAFAHDSIALQSSVGDELILADTQDPKLPAPRPRGQHGHFNENRSMRSFLALWGKELDNLQASSIKANTEVVPAIANALRWPAPEQCKKSASK